KSSSRGGREHRTERDMMEWLRWYNGPGLGTTARHVGELAHADADSRRSCFPAWRTVERESGLSVDAFLAAFDELCGAGVVFSGFPSLLPALAEKWPPVPMFGPASQLRPPASEWGRIRRVIFARDDY